MPVSSHVEKHPRFYVITCYIYLHNNILFPPRKKFSRTIPAIWRPFPTPGPCSAGDKMVCALRGRGQPCVRGSGLWRPRLGRRTSSPPWLLPPLPVYSRILSTFSSHFCNFSLLMHTFTHWHTSAYVSIRQHPSAYVSIRQHLMPPARLS